MRISTLMNCGVSSNFYSLMINKQKNCVFKATLWEDDYDENSIFYHMDKRDRINNVTELDFSCYRKDSGIEISDEHIKQMKISAAKYIGNNCYKGGMESASNHVKELKENGIKKMIVLCNPSECDISKACRENDMDWLHVYTPTTFQDPKAKKDFLENFSYENFISTVKSLREGNVFTGCESGNLRTNRFLHAIKLLDPKCKLNLGNSDSESYDYLFANWIYKGLSSAHKAVLNYTEEFEKKLVDDIALYMPMRFRTVI